jgi:hypothetical protein
MRSSSHLAAALCGFAAATLLLGLASMQTQYLPGPTLGLSTSLTAVQQEILGHMSIVYLPDGQGGSCKTIRFTDVNVQIVNGMGKTMNTNCVGNLILGYNELGNSWIDLRTGSHNLVVGRQNSYSSYGGVVVGSDQVATGVHACVLGGKSGRASGDGAVVVGGELGMAGGTRTAAFGGFNNVVNGSWNTIAGGRDNIAASGSSFGTVSGGGNNVVQHDYATVRGGCLISTGSFCEAIP